ncbi:MAG: type II toxin-antitoxin system RelE/ParE family toxin [Planctomycetales bacterium]|nr:type II toxin-antitoxin system RelE/ParE family toxin [Planctomycetales bacterium]
MPRLRYTVSAREDIKRIAAYIARDKPRAARQWSHALRARCRVLASHPETGDLRSEFANEIRSAYFGAYVIFFRDAGSFTDILRIVRGDQDIRKRDVLG